MEKEWICIYCNQANKSNAKYCIKCNAKIPEVLTSLSSEGIGEDQEGEVANLPEEEQQSFPIPAPGDIIGPMLEFCEQAIKGEISATEFGERIRTALDKITPVFDTIYDSLESIETDVDDYRDKVMSLLENVHFMFVKGFEEMALFEEDQDTSHIIFGRNLAQRAELEFIQVMEMIKHDAKATMNPFEGAPNVLGNLAEKYYNGEISLDDFQEQVKLFRETTNNYFREGKRLLDEGFELAAKFDGKNETVIEEAINKLEMAGDEISKAIINLHTQEEIKASVAQILEQNVEKEIIMGNE